MPGAAASGERPLESTGALKSLNLATNRSAGVARRRRRRALAAAAAALAKELTASTAKLMASSSADAEYDEEPMLKYQRLSCVVSEILASDAACCLGVHEKFLALGTRKGVVHILDLNGNAIQRFAPHSAAVNDICVDRTGEFVGSCSQDGTVVISSMYGAEASTHWHHRPVCAIALDGAHSVRRVFTTGGLAGQLVLNTKGWFGAKDAIIHAGEGPVRAIRSRGGLIAWANDAGVKVYDARNKERVSYVERPADAPLAERFRPHLLWHASGADGGAEPTTELLIGWADSVKIGRLRAREGIGPATVDRTRYYLEVVSIIQTDCYVAGLAVASVRPERTLSGAFHEDILLLAYVCEPADEEERGAARRCSTTRSAPRCGCSRGATRSSPPTPSPSSARTSALTITRWRSRRWPLATAAAARRRRRRRAATARRWRCRPS